jgi:hypothetical protein
VRNLDNEAPVRKLLAVDNSQQHFFAEDEIVANRLVGAPAAISPSRRSFQASGD